MSWIQTHSGKQFFPLEPRDVDFDINDVAHSLSLQCRFNGHCRSFYSVAQHSVLVASILDGPDRLWGLLHDAAEAYVSDLPRPVKQQIPAFSAIEDRILEQIIVRHHLTWPMPPRVRWADDTLLATELRDLMAPAPQPWGVEATPLDITLSPMPPDEAKAMFLAWYSELTRPAS